jgi:hypothetical protein
MIDQKMSPGPRRRALEVTHIGSEDRRKESQITFIVRGRAALIFVSAISVVVLALVERWLR